MAHFVNFPHHSDVDIFVVHSTLESLTLKRDLTFSFALISFLISRVDHGDAYASSRHFWSHFEVQP